jgi:hypothetical protein
METKNPSSQDFEKARHNQLELFSKYIILLPLVVVLPLFGAWIGYSYAPEKIIEIEKIVQVPVLIPEHITTTTTSTEVATDAVVEETDVLRTYQNSEIGIAFEYPASWGDITSEVEKGDCPSDYRADSCQQITLTFSGLGRIFFAAETLGHENFPVGRGGFWGDGAGEVTPNYLDMCDATQTCKKVSSEHGVLFARYYEPLFDWDTDSELPPSSSRYLLKHKDNEYYGLILSPRRMLDVSEDIEAVFENTVIKSFRYLR